MDVILSSTARDDINKNDVVAALRKEINDYHYQYPECDSDELLKTNALSALATLQLGKKAAPNIIHFLWIGNLTKTHYEYIELWIKTNPEKKFNLWSDPSCSSCLDFHNTLKEHIKENKCDNPELSLLKLKNKAYHYIVNNITHDKNFNVVANSFLIKNKISKAINKKVFSGKGYNTYNNVLLHNKDISSLFADEFEEYKKYYYYEVIIRGNLTCASDIVRLILLYKFGGVYIDIDTLPYLDNVFLETNKLVSSAKCLNDENLALAKSEGVLSKLNNDNKIAENIEHYINLIHDTPRNVKDQITNSILNDLSKFSLKKIKPLGDVLVYENFLSLSSLVFLNGVYFNNIICSCAKSKALMIILMSIKKRYRYIEKNNALFNLKKNSTNNNYLARLLEYRYDEFRNTNFVTQSLTGPRLISEVLLALSYKVLGLDDDISPLLIATFMQNDSFGIAFLKQNMDTPLGLISTLENSKSDMLGISALILSYNEENTISTAIDSIIDLVDEIVVVDTGSTDNTVEKVLGYTSKVVLYKTSWNEDFSEIRNYGISVTQNPWCIVLDADEYIDEVSRPIFKDELYKIINEDGDFLYAPFIDNLNGTYLTNNARIFKKRSSLKYRGKVHEYLDADNDFLIGIPQIKINHTGYLSEVYHDKNKFFRNKNLLSKQIFLEPENPRWKYFMLRYLACDDTEYSSILDFFASLPLPYEPSIEVYALNVKIMLIKKLMHENKYHDAYCHAQVLFEHYTDKITALLYSSCKYFEAKNKFMLIINEVETIYSSLESRIDDEYIFERIDDEITKKMMADILLYKKIG